MLRSRFAIFAAFLALFCALPMTAHAKSFRKIPEAKTSESALRMRLVRYEGSTNGEMVIEVKNTGKTAARFQSEGLFFVPKGDPETAPQRLGASGPFTEVATDGTRTVHTGTVSIAPGASKTLHLEVFCIDSHRSSPSSETAFVVADKRLPKDMRAKMAEENAKVYRAAKGKLKPAKSEVQSNMWKVRDAKWVPIQGERKKEKAPPSVQEQSNVQRRYKQPIRRHQSNVDGE